MRYPAFAPERLLVGGGILAIVDRERGVAFWNGGSAHLPAPIRAGTVRPADDALWLALPAYGAVTWSPGGRVDLWRGSAVDVAAVWGGIVAVVDGVGSLNFVDRRTGRRYRCRGPVAARRLLAVDDALWVAGDGAVWRWDAAPRALLQ